MKLKEIRVNKMSGRDILDITIPTYEETEILKSGVFMTLKVTCY